MKIKSCSGILLLMVCYSFSKHSLAQAKVGIGGQATRAWLEIFGAAGNGPTVAIFGGESSGISFQKDWPTVGFNQYRHTPGAGYGTRISSGRAAVQYFDPNSGTMALDMFGVSGIGGTELPAPTARALTIFPNAGVCVGSTNFNTGLGVDKHSGNARSIALLGTLHYSYINQSGNFPTHIQPGKNGGYTYIADVPGSKIIMGSGSSQVAINNKPFYLTTLSITHPAAGMGMRIMHESNGNNWEWYLNQSIIPDLILNYNNTFKGAFSHADGAYFSASDERLKQHSTVLKGTLEKLLQLNPVSYHLGGKESNVTYAGFLAQELAQIFPTAVLNPNENDPNEIDVKMIDYAQLFVLALAAVQEQQQRIAALQKELAQFNNKESNDTKHQSNE